MANPLGPLFKTIARCLRGMVFVMDFFVHPLTEFDQTMVPMVPATTPLPRWIFCDKIPTNLKFGKLKRPLLGHPPEAERVQLRAALNSSSLPANKPAWLMPPGADSMAGRQSRSR